MAGLAVFRFDASRLIGGGHAYRCLTLARALAGAGWSIMLACRPETFATVPAVADFPAIRLEGAEDEETDTIAAAVSVADLLVVDHYGLDIHFEDSSRLWARRILVIDDLADRRHEADLLLDQTYGRSAESYKHLVPAHCTMLLGAGNALLRKQFAIARPGALARRRSRRAERILVAMGATDPNNMTGRTLDGIVEAGLEVSVDVVLGPNARHLEAIRKRASDMGPRVRVLTGVADMASLMAAADLAVGAAGTSSWERCCLGLPTLLVICAENQKLVANNLANTGAALLLGDHDNVDSCSIGREAARLMNDADALANMTGIAATICDGLGARRIALTLAPILVADGSKVTLRPATLEDMKVIYEWQCEPGVRRYFRNSSVPTPADHSAWYANKLADPGCIFHIIELNSTHVGCVRLDLTKTGYEVSILISSIFQGKGVGRAALQALSFVMPWAHLEAEVVEGNSASVAAFLAAGFVQTGTNRLQRTPSATHGHD